MSCFLTWVTTSYPILGLSGIKHPPQVPLWNHISSTRMNRLRHLETKTEPSRQEIVDSSGEKQLSPLLFSYLASLRTGVLVYRAGSSLVTEPYASCRFVRQFVFSQSRPLSLKASDCKLSFFEAYYHWRVMMHSSTCISFTLPNRNGDVFVTYSYAYWWIDSSYFIL